MVYHYMYGYTTCIIRVLLILDYKGVIRSFQEFCSLMWLLDVRNELALASRQYSKLKQKLPVVSFLFGLSVYIA
jgi:hypothetical protein